LSSVWLVRIVDFRSARLYNGAVVNTNTMLTIAENVAGTGVIGNTGFVGQSFTTIPGHVFNHIVFNFFAQAGNPISPPYAIGNGFLFEMPYAGSASNVSANAPGFLGQTAAANGFWTFPQDMILRGGTKYYFYTGLIGMGAIAVGGVYQGGEGYAVSDGSTPFEGGVASRNFRVTGSPVGRPLPPSSLRLVR
jgi:hypothetical protein